MKKIDTSFSIAFIDLFAGAMGAIMLLFVIVPKKEADAVQLKESQMIENKSQSKAVKLQKCLFIRMEWQDEDHDVDLHVEMPNGTEYSYMVQDEAGKTLLSEDDLEGPGIEEFGFTENPPTGRYKVYYELYSRHGNRDNSHVSGLVIYKGGVIQLPKKTLTQTKNKVLVADVVVDNNGDVRVVSY